MFRGENNSSVATGISICHLVRYVHMSVDLKCLHTGYSSSQKKVPIPF